MQSGKQASGWCSYLRNDVLERVCIANFGMNSLRYTMNTPNATEICQRTFQSKQTVNLIIRNLLNEEYVTVEERKENKREKIDLSRTFTKNLTELIHQETED